MDTSMSKLRSVFRVDEGLGVWEHRGKVAVVGIGHTPIDRRWDDRPETSLGAYSILAAQRALDDAGLKMEDIDGVVSTPRANIPEWTRPLPPPYNTADGVSKVTAEWLVQNMGLKNATFIENIPDSVTGNIAHTLNYAAQAVGDGLAKTILVRYTMGNFAGRYSQAGGNSEDEAKGGQQWSGPWGWGAAGTDWAYLFGVYCRKYGSSGRERMAPFVVNQRRNGRMFPDGYYAQHPEPALTVEDYLGSRWISKPLCIHDCDRPVQGGACYIVTSAERAKDLKQPPVYFLNHTMNLANYKSTVPTLDEVEGLCDSLAKKLYEGSGLTAKDIDVYNPYDGFTLFTQYYLEAMQWHGVKRGEAHDFYAGDISVEGPHPLCPSGGNNGNGRTRCSLYTDSIQQLRGQAGERQIRLKAETAMTGETLPHQSAWTVFSKYPS